MAERDDIANWLRTNGSHEDYDFMAERFIELVDADEAQPPSTADNFSTNAQVAPVAGAPTSNPASSLPQTTGQMTYDEASKGDVAAELGRSVARGGQYAVEFAGDLFDIGSAAVDQFIPGYPEVMTPGGEEYQDQSMWEAINPFGEQDWGDKQREISYGYTEPLTEERIQRGDNVPLDMAKTAAEYVIPTVTGGGVGTGKQALATTMATMGGASVGEQVGGMFSPEMGEIGEVIGSMASPVAASRLPRALNAADSVDDVDHAAKVIAQISDDPDALLAKLDTSLAEGNVGTVASHTGDPQLYNIEAAAPAGSDASRAVQRTDEAALSQTLDRIRDTTGAVDELRPQAGLDATMRRNTAVQDINAKASDRRNTANANASQGLDASMGRVAEADTAAANASQTVDELTGAAVVPGRVSEQSTQLAARYDELEQTLRNPEGARIWDEFDNLPEMSTEGVSDFVSANIARMTPYDQAGIRSAFSAEIQALEDLGTNASPRELQSVIRGFNAKLKNPDVRSISAAEHFAGGITKEIEGFLEASTAGTVYTAARQATADMHARVNPGSVGNARATARSAGAPETMFRNLGIGKEQGAVAAREILASGDPAVISQAEQTIRTIANRDGIDAAFMNKFDEALQTLNPTMHAEFSAIRMAQDKLADAQGTASSVLSAERQVQTQVRQTQQSGLNESMRQQSASRRALDDSILSSMADNPKKLASDALENPDALRDIVRVFGGTEEGMETVRRLVNQQVIERFVPDSGIIDPSRVAKFNKVRRQLEDAGILTADEIAVVDELLGSASSAATLRSQARPQSANNSNRVIDMGSSAAAAAALRVLPGNSLILAGGVRRFVKDLMLNANDPRLLRAIDIMAEQPEVFAEALAKQNAALDQSVIKAIMLDIGETVLGTGTPAIMVNSGDDESPHIFNTE